ncbi:MAG: TauD/TfdA family dioxygenase [Planctomycetota bacterium]|jgi:alpha-ketoglutarate-dependent taurine dioxygenase
MNAPDESAVLPDPAPLTASGAGRRLAATAVSPVPEPANLRAWLDEHRFLVVRDAARDVDGARNWLARLGPPIEHERRTDGVLELDGSKDDSEVLRGCAGMPLHKDGLLMGIDVPYVGIFCERFRDVEAGRTRICDAQSALAELPADLRSLLEHNGIEAQAVDTDYYLKEGGTWHPLPALIETPAGPSLNLGLPYDEGDRPSWRVRVAGVDPATSDAALTELRSVLHDPRFTYQHDWREGDLLLLANHRVLHGREPYRGDRVLANLQARRR